MSVATYALPQDAPPPELVYSEKTAEIFGKLVSIVEQILAPAKERIAEYLAEAEIYEIPLGDNSDCAKTDEIS